MGLTPKQIRAAELLAKGHSQQEAGKAVGASRRTVSRWLQKPEFKNLSFGLVGRATLPPQSPPQPPQRAASERHRQSSALTAQDLVEDALLAVRDILQNPESRSCDRLKAASLVGEWVGFGSDKNKMAEMEAVKVLIDANWVPSEVLDALIDGSSEMEKKVKDAFYNCFHNGNGNKKFLPQENPERGTVDVDFDIDDDDE